MKVINCQGKDEGCKVMDCFTLNVWCR